MTFLEFIDEAELARRLQLDAYRAGESAMRERAAGRCMEMDTRGCSDPECCGAEGPSDTQFAEAIRALPLSDEVPK